MSSGVFAGDAAELTCRSCGCAFKANPEFYYEHRLTLPTLCRACRAARAARLIELEATVTVVSGEYIFAQTSTAHDVVFVAPGCLPPDLGPLRVGDRITVAIDPKATVPPRKRPRALRVKRT